MGIKVTKKSKSEFAADLKAWRARHQLSQSKAADKLSVPVRTLQNWEIARTKPNTLSERFIRSMFNQPHEKPRKRRKKSVA